MGFCGVTPPSQMPLLDEQERSRRKAARGIGGDGGRGGEEMAPAPHRPEQNQRQECTPRSLCLEVILRGGRRPGWEFKNEQRCRCLTSKKGAAGRSRAGWERVGAVGGGWHRHHANPNKNCNARTSHLKEKMGRKWRFVDFSPNSSDRRTALRYARSLSFSFSFLLYNHVPERVAHAASQRVRCLCFSSRRMCR